MGKCAGCLRKEEIDRHEPEGLCTACLNRFTFPDVCAICRKVRNLDLPPGAAGRCELCVRLGQPESAWSYLWLLALVSLAGLIIWILA